MVVGERGHRGEGTMVWEKRVFRAVV